MYYVCEGMVRGVVSLQACRGGKFDYGVESESTDGPATADDEELKDIMEKQVLPSTWM